MQADVKKENKAIADIECDIPTSITVGLFAVVDYSYSGDAVNFPHGGLFYGGGGILLGVQIIGVLIEIAWVVTTTAILFLCLKMAGILRTPADIERAGMDVSKHGGHAYPADALPAVAH